jgi:hypothetical protein
MKGSDSSTSLTNLRDTGCSICAEGEGEKGEGLVDSKQLVKCGCQYVVHLSCWNMRIESDTPTCVVCDKSIVPPYIVHAIESSGEEQSHKSVGISYKTLSIILCVFLCCIAFILALVMSQRR